MPYTPQQARKAQPLAVRNARAALARLRRTDAAQADLLEKVLPAYALRLEKDGGDISVAALLKAARQGHGFIKDAFQHTARRADLLATYRRIKPLTVTKADAKRFTWPELLATVVRNHDEDTAIPLDAYLDALAKADVTPARSISYAQYTQAITGFYEAVAQKDTARAATFWQTLCDGNLGSHKDIQLIHRSLIRHAEIVAGTETATTLLYKIADRYYKKFKVARDLSLFPPSAVGEAALNKIMDDGYLFSSLLSYNRITGPLYTYSTATVMRILQNTAPDKNFISELYQQQRGDIITALLHKDDGRLWKVIASTDGIQRQQSLSIAVMIGDLTLFKRILDTRAPLGRIDLGYALRAAATASPEVFKQLQTEFPPVADEKNLPVLLAGAITDTTPLLDILLKKIPDNQQAAADIIEECLKAINSHLYLSSVKKNNREGLEKLLRLPAFGPRHHALYLRASLYLSNNENETRSYARALSRLTLTPQDRAALMFPHTSGQTIPALWVPLLSDGPVAQKGLDHALPIAVKNMINSTYAEKRDYCLGLVSLLVTAGATDSELDDSQKPVVTQIRTRTEAWQKTVRQTPPLGLADHDPSFFKPVLFEKLCTLLKEEKYYGRTAHHYAYAGCVVFGNEERLCRYLEKWADAQSRQPLHNLLQAISLPQEWIKNINLKNWGDAILRHGPAMAKLLRFADRIPSPVKNNTGEWSLTLTRATAATFAYARAGEHPALAALCYMHEVKEKDFSAALDLIRQTPPHDKNIPDITLDGADFDMPGARFRRLAPNDMRGLFLGELTDCCQSIGGNGDVCARTGYTSPDSGFYVVENARGEIIGQSWAWRGTQGELCFDSLETLGKRVKAEQWEKIVTLFAARVGATKDNDITAVTVGAGGETPVTFATAFPRTKEHYARHATVLAARNVASPPAPANVITAARPRFEVSYRDSKRQYVIWHQGQGRTKENNLKNQIKSKP